MSTSCSNARWTHSPGVDEGSFSVTVKHSDAAGNTATLTSPTPLVKDVTAPAFSFDSDLDINAVNENAWHISGSCPEDGTVTVTAGSLGSKSATCQNSLRWRTDAFDTSSISSPGTLQLSANVVDSVGNANTIPAKTVNKDTSGWAVQITLPAESQMATPINLANAASYPVSGTCSSQGGDVTVTVGRSGCYPHRLQQWGVERERRRPRHRCRCGFRGRSRQFWNRPQRCGPYGVCPQGYGDTNPRHNAPPINSHNQGSYSFSGTCTGGHDLVSISIGGIATNASCENNAWNVDGLDVASLTGDSVEMTIDVSDAAGNPAAQLGKTVIRDIVPPLVSVTSAPDIGNANQDSYTISGSCDEAGKTVNVKIGSRFSRDTPCTASGWSLVLTDTTGIDEGVGLAVVVVLSDDAGNEGRDGDDTITKDTLAPTASLTASAIISPAMKATTRWQGNAARTATTSSSA